MPGFGTDRPRQKRQINNVSGVNGVYKSNTKSKDGKNRYFWAAHYTIGPDGKRTRGSRRFYFGPNSRSEREAHEQAVRWRKRYEEAWEDGGKQGVMQFWQLPDV